MGFETYQLDEVFEFRSGLSKAKSAFGTGFPFLTFKDVFYNFFVPEALGDLVESSEDEREKGGIRRGDVFLTRTSETQDELGMSCVALRDVPNGTFNGFAKRLRPNGNVEIIPEFAAYYFRSPDFRDAITALSIPSTRASLNEPMLGRLQIRVPDPAVQKSIGIVLKAFDDKINLLRQMNVALEEMARTLFQAWFVDFLPIRAKATGATSFRGMPQELYNMLPDSFEPSEIGEIPKGWKTKPLDKIADFLNGLAMQKHRPASEDEGLPVVKIAELRKGISDDSERASSAIPEKYKVQDGDLIFSWSGSLLAKFWTGGDGALNQHLFKVTSDGLPLSFVAHWIWHHLGRFQRIAEAKATTMGHIKRGHLSEALVVLPPDALLLDFASPFDRMVQKQIANSFEQRNLAKLRSTLLPKLISGALEAPSLEALGISGAT